MLTAEREFMMSTDLKPLIKFIIENGCTAKEKLVELIDKRAIEEQIDLLVSIGCISHSDDDEIVLTDGDTESIVERLEKAASEAFKSLKDTSKKSMTYSAYRCKLKEAYKRRGRR
ncbi:hypothetical protein M0R45_023100 [Rubus argutus]|uniref:Uncharacterized protein n=1 Tax=Rubus argutus TaxID=59490 RepID=A0AAW1WLN6_RUBAR